MLFIAPTKEHYLFKTILYKAKRNIQINNRRNSWE